MRIAIISDIHSNLQALREVALKIEAGSVDMTVCAGDVVGYGADPNACCEAVRRLTQVSILGNHDVAALRHDPSGMNPYAAAAALWTAHELSENARSYLLSLKESARIDAQRRVLAMHHGSLDSIWEYLYEEDVAEEMLRKADANVLIFGHTHVPYVKKLERGLIVNPGSVGQPRDHDPRASLALVDTNPLSCSIVRVQYDIEGAAEAIIEAGLPRILAKRLEVGF